MFVARHATAITPSDVTAQKYKGIYVGGTGTLKVLLVGDTANTTFSAIPVGTTLWLNTQYVYSSGTTATLMVGLN